MAKARSRIVVATAILATATVPSALAAKPKPKLIPLTVSMTGTGGVRVGAHRVACTGSCVRRILYRRGAVVRLTPVLPPGARYTWGGGCKGGQFVCTLSITRPTQVAITFTRY